MRVLLIGSGGREHAIAHQLLRSPHIGQLYIWPSNPGIDSWGSQRLSRINLAKTATWHELGRHCQTLGIELVVVGPEKPLSEGVVDIMRQLGIPVFGPTQAAAQLESSKAFAKEVMQAAAIPTASYRACTSREATADEALRLLKTAGGAVLKASGLAAGKGVFVLTREDELENALHHLYETDMSTAAQTVVVEELLVGRECSYFSFLGNGRSEPIAFAVDYKRLKANDQGPNTGGMGSYTPVPWLPKDAGPQVEAQVVRPLIQELAKRGMDYCGCLYVGIMWTAHGPKVIEFNVRLGDPETQSLAMWDQRDWLMLMAEAAGLARAPIGINVGDSRALFNARRQQAAVTVVMASADYPYGEGSPGTGILPTEIFTERGDDVAVFAAAVKQQDGYIVSGSGRVLTVTAVAETHMKARAKAFSRVSEIRSLWPAAQVRDDIAQVVQ